VGFRERQGVGLLERRYLELLDYLNADTMTNYERSQLLFTVDEACAQLRIGHP
jgi:hypothetical protein